MDAVDIYPRPDFNRPNLNWQLLNGAWDFTFDDNDVGITEAWYRKGLPSKQDIIVPFVFQTAASCIHDRGAHEFLWYQRRVADIRTKDELSHHHRLILRFGASDYEATVWINEQYAGFHRGGHVPFDLDITDLFQASNSIDMSTSFVISVRIRDSPYDLSQPRGKQYWKPKPESIFYTPSSGIWQSVWLESVPCVRIGHSGQGTVLKSNDVENGVLHSKISIVGRRPEQNLRVEIEASLSDISIAKLENTVSDSNSVLIDLPLSIQSKPINIPESFTKFFPSTNAKCWRNGLALWSPEYPILYKITIRLYDVSKEALLDTIETYTGMRSISWQSRCMELNGSPYFQALVLDQGYWPRTGITPPSADSLKQDIILAKRMGFNGCRKHQKVEDPIFLYWADILGFLVWGEMANAYEFNDTYMERFNDEWISAVKRDINHPCIVTWTPVNESWGYDDLPGSAQQRNHLRSLYFMTRSLDPTRPVNDNCGWQHVQTDLVTFHNYSDVAELTKACSDMKDLIAGHGGHDLFVRPPFDSIGEESITSFESCPILCTEFGGLNIRPADGTLVKDGDWGYITADDSNDLLNRLDGLFMGIVTGGLVSGFVYTQLSDIEQEVNGLYTFDRKEKLNAKWVKAAMEKAIGYFYDTFGRAAAT